MGADKVFTDLITGKAFKSTGKFSASSGLANGLAILFVIFIPVSLSLRGWTITPDHGLNKPAPEMAWYQLELLYHQAAEIVVTLPNGKKYEARAVASDYISDIALLKIDSGPPLLPLLIAASV